MNEEKDNNNNEKSICTDRQLNNKSGLYYYREPKVTEDLYKEYKLPSS